MSGGMQAQQQQQPLPASAALIVRRCFRPGFPTIFVPPLHVCQIFAGSVFLPLLFVHFVRVDAGITPICEVMNVQNIKKFHSQK